MNSSALSLRSTLSLLLALASFALAATLSRADTAPTGAFAFSVDVPAGKLSAEELRAVVLKATINRGWTVKEDSTEKVVVYLNHRKNEATVTFVLSDKAIQAYCEGYATNGSGVRKGPEQPTRWLNYLKEDLIKDVGTAAYLGKK